MAKISFIVLTKDRPDTIKNFLKNHEFLLNKLDSQFIIIDGSKKNNLLKNKIIIKRYKKIKFYKQKSKGFMNGCFESIKYVNSKYCTFLYDDDLLSNEIIKVFKNSIASNFSMGFGIVENLGINSSQNKNHFKKITFESYNSEDLILGYYGKKIRNISFMPVSPICMIFKTNFLNYWKKYILKFCKKSKFRKLFLLKKNIGPDLILYLLQILKNKSIKISNPFVAKFNAHDASMSLLLGKNNLQIGYWLAKKSIFDNHLLYDKKVILKVYNFLYLSGYFILVKNIFLKIFGKENYYFEFSKELTNLKKHKNAEFNLFESSKIILKKIVNF